MEILRKLIQKRNKEVSFLSGAEARRFSEEMGSEVRGIMQITPPSPEGDARIHKVQKRVYMQVALAVSSILLIIVLIFTMTVAWYTNVAKTGSMTFRAEAWGFDSEKIRLSEDGIEVFPGTSGVIPLRVDNSGSASALRIGVTTSKEAGMDRDMQKRIFFYVDTQKICEFPQAPKEENAEPEILRETVSRVYLSDLDAYSYTVPGGQSLVMTEEYCNDVPLKWEWVYDMLGYYFRGTVKDNAVTEAEYLRPIEYDYTKAVFGRDQAAADTYGQLLSVNGVTKKELLEQLSAADGYEGVIDTEYPVMITRENHPEKYLYYPVQVDENGYGIWAYLCTLEEIESGIAYDTALAESETPQRIEATVTLTAANVSAHTAPAATAEALQALLADPGSADQIITLEGDITLTESIAWEETADARLDLNGYTLTLGADGTKAAELQVGEGQKLTLLNGTVRWDPSAGEYITTAIRSAGGSITLGNVTLEGFNDAIRIEDQTQEGDTVLQITGSEIRADRIGVFLQGNGSRSDTPTRVIIQDSHINGEGYIGICGQGSEDRWGTELVILNSTVEGKWAGLYQPQQQAVTTVSNSTIIGGTGLAVKGGTVTVTDSTVRGTGAAQPAKADGSGFTDTGDGIYVEAVYNWPASVIVKGSNTKVYSDHSHAVELFGAAGKGPGKVMLYDGTYSGASPAADAHWNEIGTFEIFGGSYTGSYTGSVDSTILRHDTPETD